MSNPFEVKQSLTHERLVDVLRICASLPPVKREVLRNHDDNRWWPLSVHDWRLRLVLAGWSTRVSYNMITTYQAVVSAANAIGFDLLQIMSDEEAEAVVAPIGLARARLQYMRSVHDFVTCSGITESTLRDTDNNALVEAFTAQVKGAGFKVAQCAVLYAKGYDCGIFPVDSGMKDKLGPCLGLRLPKGPIAHEVMRRHIEHLLHANAAAYLRLAHELGYGQLKLPRERAPVWWAHLVLIYFKRLYCNQQAPHVCPLRLSTATQRFMGAMCDREGPRPGGGVDD